MSEHFQVELCFPGIESSLASIGDLQGKGDVERFIRTLEEKQR